MQDYVKELLLKGNGVIKASIARLEGISNKELQRLTETGELERISHGLYMNAEQMEDVYFTAQYRCGKGIFSYETALYFHDLSDRTPICLMMTIPSGFNTRLLKDKENYQFFYCKPELYEIGITTMKTPFGNDILVYDKERTICDCIKKKDKLDIDIVMSALKQYMGQKSNDYARLLQYANMLRISESVTNYLEVLS